MGLVEVLWGISARERFMAIVVARVGIVGIRRFSVVPGVRQIMEIVGLRRWLPPSHRWLRRFLFKDLFRQNLWKGL